MLHLFAAVAVALASVVGISACSRGNQPVEPQTLTEIPKTPSPDADSPAESVRALTAEVALMKSETAALRRENQNLVQQRDLIAQQVTSQVKADLRRDGDSQADSGYGQLFDRVETLARQSEAQNGSKPQRSDEAPEMPVGGGDLVWIEPLGKSSLPLLGKAGELVNAAGQKVGDAVEAGGSLLHGAGDSLGDNSVLDHAGLGNAGHNDNVPQFPPEPVYTLPRNATLVGSTGMTALIGRIPVGGQLEDPYSFKVIVGADNLAANGLEIPGVDGMIFSGEAVGDWALSCVRGKLLSVTFVFEDGTIRTLSSDDQSLQQKAQDQGQQAAQGSNGNRPLGWVSDRRGIPCVSGERITNAPAFLGGRILARALGAAGQAYARSQTSITTSPLTGGFTSGVTGNPSQYAAGETAAGAADEVADWIRQRQAQSFDVVFVDTGVELAIHVDQELPIDFEPKGRKLAYQHANPATMAGDRHGMD